MLDKSVGTRTYLLLCLLLSVVTLFSYWQVSGFDFVNLDDDKYVTENLHIQNGLNGESVSWAFTSTHASNWHPLTWLSHMLDYQLWGLNPKGHHLTNLAFHLFNTLLLFFVLSRMTGSVWRSGFVAALFAVHPMHVESVAWVSERKDVLSTFFMMLTLLAYDWYAGKRGLGRYLLVTLCYVLGLLAKPMLVTLPLLLLMLDYWPLKRWEQKEQDSGAFKAWTKLIAEKIPLFVITLGSCIATVVAQGIGGAVSSLQIYPLGIRVANALVNYVNYVVKMFWPSKLSAFYPHPYDTLPSWQVFGSALLIVGVFALTISLRRRFPYLLVGWLWYVVTLVPVIGLVQVGLQAMADRYTYVPYIGLFIAISWVVPELVVKKPVLQKPPHARGKKHDRKESIPESAIALSIAAIVLIAILAGLTHSEAGNWENSVLLFQHAVENTKGNFIAYNNLGTALKNLGRDEEALENFKQAVKFKPDHALANFNLGFSLMQIGEIDQAIGHFKTGLKTSPDDAQAYYCLGMLYAEEGKTQEAASSYNRSLELNPNYAEAYNNLGVILINEGKLDEAEQRFRRALDLKPDYTQAINNLGAVFMKKKDYEKAISEYQKALQIEPENGATHSNYATALYNKGDYAGAWQEVRLARQYGYNPPQELINALSLMMPENKE